MKKLIIVTGPTNSGKTTLMSAYCSRLDFEEGLRLGGMICMVPLPGIEKTEWILTDLFTGEAKLLMTLRAIKGWEKRGRFFIDPSVFSWANHSIVQAFEHTDCLVFDEIGPIEIEGNGLYSSFSQALREYPGIIIAAVRNTLLEQVAFTFSLNLAEAEYLKTGIPLDEQYIRGR
jgi:nucleoside-triphosphatase THEP1